MGEGKSMAEPQKQLRLILHKFLSVDECKELEFIHKSCSTVGYRPNVFSTTLSHLIATNSSHLLLPFVPIRERLKERVEAFFGCEYELFVEFTGLISWSRGASIGWHSDDNRPYLKQRDFADGEPTTVVPLQGDVVMYTADSRNIHSVDEITDGERLTLTLWFSRDGSHDEDAKLVSLLSQRLLHNLDTMPHSCLPVPASSNMYWFSPDQPSDQQSGFDICMARMHVLGYVIYSCKDGRCFSDFSELLMEPLQLARGDELFDQEFNNILHALQVVQFYYWKASELLASKVEPEAGKAVRLLQSQREKISVLKSIFLKDHKMAETVFSYRTDSASGQHSFAWDNFSAAVAAWNSYTWKLCKELLMSIPHWKTHQTIFTISFDES